jgi:hypothetical protein
VFLPDKPKSNHRNYLWNLARTIAGVESRVQPKFGPLEIEHLVADWFEQTRPEFRHNSLRDYQDEVANMLIRVRCPKGETGKQWAEACVKAKNEPPPSTDVLNYRPVFALFASLCYWLSRRPGCEFFLVQTVAADFLACSQGNVSGMIAQLIHMGWIELVSSQRFEPGTGNRMANWYRWTKL